MLDLNTKAPLEYLVQLGIESAEPQVVDLHGLKYVADKQTGKLSLLPPPKLDLIAIATLGGFVDLLEADFEKFDPEATLIHVSGHDTVKLIERKSDEYGRRNTIILSVAPKTEPAFRFNEYYAQEDFLIALRSVFVQTASLEELVDAANIITAKADGVQTDNGFTQRVQANAGLALREEITLKPRVDLAPFRTFRELEQPVSTFLFRVKSTDKGISCALFEADGSAWKLAAIDRIKSWLKNRIAGSTVDALMDLPIIS